MNFENHPVFEIVTTTAGAISIRNKAVNEIMHNPVGPWLEANNLYINQSELSDKLHENLGNELVIFDVGLGAAANSLAAIHCVMSENTGRPVRLISYERDLDLLRFALHHSDKFAHFSGYETAISDLIKNKTWGHKSLVWELREGDFLQNIETEKYSAQIIFFDPYSPQLNKEMWTLETFRKLRVKSGAHSGEGAVLYTYSQATPIRTALLLAGYFVGQGSATGLKSETTEAATDIALLKSPLGARWLERWNRSESKYPFDCTAAEEPKIMQLVLGHSQFN